MNLSSDPPALLDVIRYLRAKNNAAYTMPEAGARVGFALSTRDRLDFTQQTIAAMDVEGGYDIIWNDGSETFEGREFPQPQRFQNGRVVEINRNVRGGPDQSICVGIDRLLQRGYDYVGLIENDIVLQPGWFKCLMNLFQLAADEGMACGAATVRSYESRVLEHRNGYSINWGTGAGMVLFARPAAEIILKFYSKLRMSSTFLNDFYRRLFQVDLNLTVKSAAGDTVRHEAWLTNDWGYTPMLYLHGYASLGSIPSLATDLEFAADHFLLQDYVTQNRTNAGILRSRVHEKALR